MASKLTPEHEEIHQFLTQWNMLGDICKQARNQGLLNETTERRYYETHLALLQSYARLEAVIERYGQHFETTTDQWSDGVSCRDIKAVLQHSSLRYIAQNPFDVTIFDRVQSLLMYVANRLAHDLAEYYQHPWRYRTRKMAIGIGRLLASMWSGFKGLHVTVQLAIIAAVLFFLAMRGDFLDQLTSFIKAVRGG